MPSGVSLTKYQVFPRSAAASDLQRKSTWGSGGFLNIAEAYSAAQRKSALSTRALLHRADEMGNKGARCI